MIMGPNEKRLTSTRMAQIAVPPGGGIGDALRVLSSIDRLCECAGEASTWVRAAIAAVRSAPDNTYTTDEEICGEILRRVDERDARDALAGYHATSRYTPTGDGGIKCL